MWKKEIKPLLEENCWKCHGADKVRAELVLTTREGVLAGGEVGPAVDMENPAASLMLEMVSYKNEDHQMPPIGKLPQNKIDALGKWIEMGLPFPKEDEIVPKNAHSHASTTEVNETTKSHWAYKKPVACNIPNLPEYANPIDRFIQAKLAEQNLPANPPAKDHTLIRRMYYDLIGLPPPQGKWMLMFPIKNPRNLTNWWTSYSPLPTTERNGADIGLILFAMPKPMGMRETGISRRHGDTGIM